MSRLASEDNVKSYLQLSAPSINMKHLSIFKLAPSQHGAISCFKELVPTENIGILLKQSLWSVGFLIQELIPRNRARNTNSIVLPHSKN